VIWAVAPSPAPGRRRTARRPGFLAPRGTTAEAGPATTGPVL